MFVSNPEHFSFIKTSAEGLVLGDIAIRIPDGMYWQADTLGYLFGLSFTNKSNWDTDPLWDKDYWHVSYCEVSADKVTRDMIDFFPKEIPSNPFVRVVGYNICDEFPLLLGGVKGSAVFYTHVEPWIRTPSSGGFMWQIGLHAAFKTSARDEDDDPVFLMLEIYKAMEPEEMLKYRNNPMPLLETAPFSTVLAGIRKVNN